MADQEIKKIINVDIQATDSLNTLIKQIDELSKKLETLDKSSQEYKDILAILAKNQAKLSSAMKGVKKDADDAEGSYNALSKRMSSLRKEWKATNDEAKRQELGKQIAGINTELKGLDASIGSFQRNVGSYEQAMTNVFKTPQQRIKELRDQLAQLNEGTEEYNSTLMKLSELTRSQTKLNEQLKYSSADVGDVIGNIAGVAQGVIGGLGAIQGVMALFGEDDHYAETIKNLNAIMAIVQGLGALEGLRDKIKGLGDAWKGFKKSAEGTTGAISGMNEGLKSTAGTSEQVSSSVTKTSNILATMTQNVQRNEEAVKKQTISLEDANKMLLVYKDNLKKRGEPSEEQVEREKLLVDIFGEEIVKLEKTVAIEKSRLDGLHERFNLLQNIYRTQVAINGKEGEFEQMINAEIEKTKEAARVIDERLKQDSKRLEQLKTENQAKKQLNTTTQQLNQTEEKQVGLIAKTTEWFKKLWNETLNVDRVNKAANKSFLAMGASEAFAADSAKLLSLSLKGLKAAITATGVGALIVLAGELINLLFKGVDAFKGWISGANRAKRQADELKSSMDALKKSFEEQNDEIDFQVRMMEAAEESYESIYEYKKKAIQQELEHVRSLKAESDAYKKYLTLTEKQKKKSKYEGIVEAAEELNEWEERLLKQLKKLDQDKAVHNKAEETKALNEANKELEKSGTKAWKSIGSSTDDAAQKLKKYRDELQKTIDEYNNLITGLDRGWESPIDRIKREYQERMDLADRAEKAETDLLKSQLDEREISREEYERRSLEIAQKYSEGRIKIQRKETEEGKRILGQQATESAKTEVSGIQSSYKGSEDDKKIEERIRKAQDTIAKAGQKFSIWDILMGKDQGLETYKEKLAQAEQAYNDTLTKMNQDYEDKKAALKSQMDVWAQVMDDETVDDETRAKARAEYTKLETESQDATTENLVANMELRAEYMKTEDELYKEHVEKVINYNQQMVSAVSGLFGSMADMYEQDAENRKDGDEKSQKVAKKSYKKAQALRIAEATINTLNGAIGGFMQATATYPAPYGQILGAAVSAAAIASGMAQIQKIRSTSFDSSGSSLGSGGTTFQLPQIEQYEPTYTQNVTQESDTDRLMNAVTEGMSKTQLYVSVTDINNVQNKVKVTENEASW